MAARKAAPPVPKKGTGGAAKTRGRGDRSPVPPKLTQNLAAEAVNELPEARGSDSRTARYAQQMAEVRRLIVARKVHRESWVPIAEFSSPRGASEIKRKLLLGLRPVDGLVEDWDIEARRMEMGGSVLWVRLK